MRKTISRRRLVALSIAAVLVLAGSAQAQPPAGLSANGQLTWQLEALLHDRFGDRPVYLVYATGNLSAKAASLPMPSRGYYAPVFDGASASSFRLIARSSSPSAQPVAVRVAGKYVSCGTGRWLVFGHGAANLALDCIR